MPQPTQTSQGLSVFKRVWFALLNLIGQKNEYRVIVTSKDYMEIEILWGVLRFEKGEKREFVIRGTEAFFKAFLNTVKNKGFDVSREILK